MNTCRDNDGGSGSDSDGACSIMPPAVTFEALRFDLSSVPPAPKSKPVPTYKAPFKKSAGGDVATSPENPHKKKRNEIPSFGKELANTVRRSNQKRSVFSAFSAAQLLVGRVEVHRLQCKNCQYRFLGQYPSKMYDFFS